jgi:hypothetical protein
MIFQPSRYAESTLPKPVDFCLRQSLFDLCSPIDGPRLHFVMQQGLACRTAGEQLFRGHGADGLLMQREKDPELNRAA